MNILYTSVAALYYLRHTTPFLVQCMQAQKKGSFTKVTILSGQSVCIEKIDMVKYLY